MRVLLVLGIIVAGCTRAEEKSVVARAQDSGVVAPTQPIDVIARAHAAAEASTLPCSEAPCRTYAKAVADVKSMVRAGSSCSEASTGKCGARRYVHYNHGFGGYTEYFDDAGVMKGTHSWSDMDAAGINYGEVPACDQVPSETWCKNGERDAGKDKD